MSEKGRTLDEKFLIQLYQTTLEKGQVDADAGIDYRIIAAKLGQKETAVKNIIKHLAQANFIEKIDDTALIITQRGCNFVLNELYHS